MLALASLFIIFSPELYRCCATGDLPRVKELLEEASTTTINKLYQGGSTLLYKYTRNLKFAVLSVFQIQFKLLKRA